MKIILGIFCALVVLFAGGCAVIVLIDGGFQGGTGSVPLALIPGAVALLNIIVLVGLLGKSPPQRWAFYVLAGVDVLAALAMGALWASVASQMADVAVIAIPVIAILLLKAWLTVKVVNGLPPPSG
jgi:hypothetical protein